jgi:uncharacterized protein (DUF952 family)
MLKFFLFLPLLLLSPLFGEERECVPQKLFKVVTVQNWNQSQEHKHLLPSPDDTAFYHLATEAQVPRVVDKFFANEKQYYVVTLETKKLKGTLKLETNPGGSTKYYHLYDGTIPLTAILEARLVTKQ